MKQSSDIDGMTPTHILSFHGAIGRTSPKKMATLSNATKNAFALGAFDKKAELYCFEIARPAVSDDGVAIDIQYCGMCHSDCHACNGDWGIDTFPIAPGHEIAGLVTAVGKNVTKFQVGDRVGVGCMVESCQDCDM